LNDARREKKATNCRSHSSWLRGNRSVASVGRGPCIPESGRYGFFTVGRVMVAFFVPTTGLSTMIVSFFVPTTGTFTVSLVVPTVGVFTVCVSVPTVTFGVWI